MSDDNLESFTINKVLLITINVLTLLGMGYFALILFLNTEILYKVYEEIPIGIYQSFLTVLLTVTVYINIKLILEKNESEDRNVLLVLTIVYLLLALVHAVLLYNNPTTFNLINRQFITGVIIQPTFVMIYFYPLVVIFYFLPFIIYIRNNKSLDYNIKLSLTLFCSSFGVMLYTQCSKIWNTTGWNIRMISFKTSLSLDDQAFITNLSNFKISALGYFMMLLSLILFIGGVITLLRDIQIEPNSIFTLIPYLFLILIIASDYIFSELPANIKFFNTFLIVIWLLIGAGYTVAYTMIPNSVLNSQLTEKGKFTPNIRARIHDKKLETQILDAIDENQIRKLIEISSFLGVPYHKVLKSLKSLILQGYISGRILNQQFVSVDSLHSFKQTLEMPEFPSPFEIWKLTMINEGVISIEDLSAIMSIDYKDLEIALTNISESQPKKNTLLDGFIYIQMIGELDSLHSQILGYLTKTESSVSYDPNSFNNRIE